ncbi:MAG: hypothetical protein IKS55_06920 [Oscillospiraceae bacterium]|nr:hypothetical protein [Oscillospiraceae bacterium]
MTKERKLQALDDSVLDAVTGGVEQIASDLQSNDEIRVNIFGNEPDSGVVLHKSRIGQLIKLFWRY